MNKRCQETPDSDNFTQKLLGWDQVLPGRGLPWAFSCDPYHVWISEIMLQQTQAQTVVPYFEKFVNAFPDVQQLANAPIDEIMNLWAGLGYYSRARNLHSAAQIIRDHHQGVFPQDFNEILDLPGIGKSTAGAICAFAYGMRTPILDGNAKRVYTRYYCVDDDSDSVRIRKLWEIADKHTPDQNTQAYTQAIMDLGATICTPRNPQCHLCPLPDSCCAKINELTDRLPRRKRTRNRIEKFTMMLMIQDQSGKVLLERRPPKGVWGNLWSFPEYTGKVENLIASCHKNYHLRIRITNPWQCFNHDFTHFRLNITPQPALLLEQGEKFDGEKMKFLEFDEISSKGVPAPVQILLEALKTWSIQSELIESE